MKNNKRFEKLSQDERQLISKKLITAAAGYLELFISPVIVRRILSAVLVIAGVHSKVITELTGLCERSIRDLKHQLVSGEINDIFEVKSGRGRKAKMGGIESQIVKEIESENYQTLQQIVDMIQEKFNIKTSITAVHRLLKKRHPEAESGLIPGKG